MAKIHWTRTPEGRRVLSERAKGRKHWTHRRKEAQGGNSGDNHEAPETVVAYAVGFVQSWIDSYAGSCGVPSAALAQRVGELLQRAARGKVLGP